jgi:hypothetical protein
MKIHIPQGVLFFLALRLKRPARNGVSLARVVAKVFEMRKTTCRSPFGNLNCTKEFRRLNFQEFRINDLACLSDSSRTRSLWSMRRGDPGPHRGSASDRGDLPCCRGARGSRARSVGRIGGRGRIREPASEPADTEKAHRCGRHAMAGIRILGKSWEGLGRGWRPMASGRPRLRVAVKARARRRRCQRTFASSIGNARREVKAAAEKAVPLPAT